MQIKRIISKLFYALMPPAVLILFARINRTMMSIIAKPLLSGQTRLHLGSGNNMLPGWANIDLSGGKSVIKLDLTFPLPVSSGTVKFIFSEHLIEHIRRDQAKALIKECFRVLEPNGTLRISTPGIKKLIDNYLVKKADEMIDVNWSPATPCQMVNEGMRLWGHQFIYDATELGNLLHECGFTQIVYVRWRESMHHELNGLECRPFHGEIIVEATK
jgi:predicted SAM-dependent methyltransferase